MAGGKKQANILKLAGLQRLAGFDISGTLRRRPQQPSKTTKKLARTNVTKLKEVRRYRA